ncbi:MULTISPECIES: metalloprotease [Haloarcula]|uniref:Zn-dependent protease n=1 Tax=Haloarcula pellucida TaxID=1427151 RepID=A0A830GI16_9EURY|nr:MULTISPECIES: metalloprotease [Halomicroarcula]MBX0347298.1 metalloprotease [Halomicroarcula pellucida]MDS0276827.1 metalloprotease [Halomicroarcula sp. S1AR25-4]GGN87988.1 Zn-dependent protease [Halomicroarcula pellucida]
MNLTFSRDEVQDLLIAWLALGVAFTLLLERELRSALLGQVGGLTLSGVSQTLVVSLLTVGVGFLLHELAHKVVAVRFGQVAAFKADYRMLGFAIVGALVGFLFAAPGAVVHRGRISKRENGLIALAGPVTNILLAVVFVVPFAVAFFGYTGGIVWEIARRGLQINLLLAGFNMLPFGPLDGRKVRAWSNVVFFAVAIPSVLLGVGALVLL